MNKLELLRAVISATLTTGFLVIDRDDVALELSNEGLIEVNEQMPGLDSGKVAARATDAGKVRAEQSAQTQTASQNTWGGQPQNSAPTNFGEAAAQQTAQTSAPADTSNSAPVFIKVSGEGFAPAATKPKREGVKRDAPEKYPFGELKAPTKNADGSINWAGTAVFVPSTKDKAGKMRTPEEMAFSLLSACAAAGRRYSRELPPEAGSTRKRYDKSVSFATKADTLNGIPGAYIYREFKEGASA